jgi:16S rRNA (uracil1498-N3)-methyltransferase
MKIHRFVGPWQLALGAMRIDDTQVAHQMRSVLHLEVGEPVVVADGAGMEAQCTIAEYQPGAVVLECITLEQNQREPSCQVTLFLSILKADHFESACRQATEVGVHDIIPVVSSRTIKQSVRIDRVSKIVREAAEVAGRAVVPRVHETTILDDALSQAAALDANYCFDTQESAKPLRPASAVTRAGVWIGPEGGWSEGELETFDRLGITRVTLGPLVMRADTAAAVGVFLVAHQGNV